VLYEALGSGEATLTLSHYRALGGFDAIVGEHLDRVLETELAGGDDMIARDLFLALVTNHERAMRPEDELVEIVGARHDAKRILDILETLRSRGLLVRLRVEGQPVWELVHDSLVPRVLAWIDRRDLAKRRAVELVRYHLRRSQPGVLSLLNTDELEEIREHLDAIAELDTEWKKRNEPVTPLELVGKSKAKIRRARTLLIGAVVVLLAIAAVVFVAWRSKQHQIDEAQAVHDRDLGRFVLELAPFDWDPATQRAIPVAASELPKLTWTLHAPSAADDDAMGELLRADYIVRGTARDDGFVRVEHVEAHGGAAFLEVTGRGRTGESCRSSIVRLRRVPGSAERTNEQILHIPIPSCRATVANTVEIPAGSFIFGGLGEPPGKWATEADGGYKEQRIDLPAFRIDRTEVTNAAFNVLMSTAKVTGIKGPTYSTAGNPQLADPESPVASITALEAREYCQYLGKKLPTSAQWVKAMRGGETLPGGTNPYPRRNLPWGDPKAPARANLGNLPNPQARHVGSFPDDVSPYGVLDMAGNVAEWIRLGKDQPPGMQIARGTSYAIELRTDALADYLSIDNQRQADARSYDIGVRCVIE
jgi:formylglycine-generating enzyme required for sulfatase activity